MDFDTKSAVASYFDWWSNAGLTDTISEQNHSWLGAGSMPSQAFNAESIPIPAQPVRPAEQPHPAGSVTIAGLPDTLAGLDNWFAANADTLCPEGGSQLVLPIGPASPPVMILSDMPDEEDLASGRLFSGDRHDLLVAMLGAIGLDIDQQRRASILLTRPHGRQMPVDVRSRLLAIANHHIAIVRPSILLLLGPQACQLLTGHNDVPAPENQPFFNHGGVKTGVFATHKLRLLIDRPHFKRHAWEILKRMKDMI